MHTKATVTDSKKSQMSPSFEKSSVETLCSSPDSLKILSASQVITFKNAAPERVLPDQMLDEVPTANTMNGACTGKPQAMNTDFSADDR